ncbi:hypothetical protein BDR05DRAFT_957769 [Suillus weaverae]|nr:hypothetical protein BDR05DRAFT_957769 [Suillus weaverae]
MSSSKEVLQTFITSNVSFACMTSLWVLPLVLSKKLRDVETIPPVKLKSFNWTVGKGKMSKCASHNLHRRFVEVQIPHTEDIHCLPRITFAFNLACSSWTVNRKQFPLHPAYATTFNGSQGLTLEKMVLDLRTDSFAHGQLYTALSRVHGILNSVILIGLNAHINEYLHVPILSPVFCAFEPAICNQS